MAAWRTSYHTVHFQSCSRKSCDEAFLSVLCQSYRLLWVLLSSLNFNTCLYLLCSSLVLSLNIISLPLSCHSLSYYFRLTLLISICNFSTLKGPLFTTACTLRSATDVLGLWVPFLEVYYICFCSWLFYNSKYDANVETI